MQNQAEFLLSMLHMKRLQFLFSKVPRPNCLSFATAYSLSSRARVRAFANQKAIEIDIKSSNNSK